MPTRPLTQNDNLETISQWLDENLQDHNSIKACPEEIRKVPNKKGIYFWFMHPDAYRELSNYVPIHPVSPRYSRIIEGVSYDLVYLGTAGTGKNGNSTMNERLDWHVNQKHRESTINQKQSALSTLRTGLGSLLSDDLIEFNTEDLVNQIMKDYFVVYFIEYPDNKGIIDIEEVILIKELKPIFNIKKNPNSLKIAIKNSTKLYKKRRNEVELETKKRLQSKVHESNELTFKKVSPNKNKKETKGEIIDYNIEMEFSNAQDIHLYFSKQKFDSGDWHFLIFETKNPSRFICENWTKTGIPNKYFGNTETNKNRMIDNKQVVRWKIIEKEMTDKNIESVTVKFFKLKK
jgi:hypothetical protein